MVDFNHDESNYADYGAITTVRFARAKHRMLALDRGPLLRMRLRYDWAWGERERAWR